jgi:hypothetical protein
MLLSGDCANAMAADRSGYVDNCTRWELENRPASPEDFPNCLIETGADFAGCVAERVGFEPTVRLPVRRISSAVLSTTQPPLRMHEGAGRGAPAGRTRL